MKKVLLLGEFSGYQNNLKQGLLEIGIDATLAASSDGHRKFPADIKFGRGGNRYLDFARSVLLPVININKFTGYDIVHAVNLYISPHNAFLNKVIFFNLTKTNERMSLALAGDDPLYVRHAESVFRYSPIPANEKYDRKSTHWMKANHQYKFASEVLPLFDFKIPVMYDYFAPYRLEEISGLIPPIPLPINCDAIKYRDNNVGKKMVVFHGLSRAGFKGTHIIRDAFDILSKKYPSDFHFIIAGGMAIDQYMSVMQSTNVVVDQLYSYSLAMTALQAMALGKIVIGGVEPESKILYENNVSVPAYNSLPRVDDLVERLLQLHEIRRSFSDLGSSSRDFVQSQHGHVKVAKRYSDLWFGDEA